jgi:hypothetical protein
MTVDRCLTCASSFEASIGRKFCGRLCRKKWANMSKSAVECEKYQFSAILKPIPGSEKTALGVAGVVSRDIGIISQPPILDLDIPYISDLELCTIEPTSPSLFNLCDTRTTTTTRAQQALKNITPARVNDLMSASPRYSESTLRKNQWVVKLYYGFCQTLECSPWPLTSSNSAGFVRFLGLEAKYAVGSVEDVVIPSLKRLHVVNTSLSVPADVHLALSQALRDVKNSKSSLRPALSKEPAISPDVEKIIERTPDGLPTKSTEASLWLVALSTGARAVTCHSVLIGDISNVYANPNLSGEFFVQLTYRVTKGNPNWNHVVTLEGDPSIKSNMNVVYWLNRHLMKSKGLELSHFQSWASSVKKEPLWPWSKDSMREIFTSRAIAAGFPKGIFSFHSLRAGFICSALLKAGTDPAASRAILENTAFVAGWVPNQPAQLRYVKECARKTIISSRLVIPSDTNENRSIIDPFLTSSETFHGIKLQDPSWDPETNYRLFHEKLDEKFIRSDLNGFAAKAFKLKCWRKALSAFVQGDEALEALARLKYREKSSWTVPGSRCQTEMDARVLVGRKHIAQALESDFDQLTNFVDRLFGPVSEIVNAATLKAPSKKRKPLIQSPESTDRNFEKGHRKRVKWSMEEDIALVKSRKDGKPWVVIARTMAGLRSNVDCKDRYRNLLSKYGSDEDLYELFSN